MRLRDKHNEIFETEQRQSAVLSVVAIHRFGVTFLFFLTYLHRELSRRLGRTIFTVLGFAVGVGLVVAIAALSSGLEDAQGEILSPLGSIGTDLSVTRPVVATTQDTQAGQGGGRGGFGLGGGGRGNSGLTPEDQAALLDENQSVITDLSQLGESGETFVHDYFLPADQLTFPEEDLAQVEQIDGVAQVAKGLTLLAVHQEGTVPEIVAEIETGGEELEIARDFSPPTAAEQDQMRGLFPGKRGKG